jgi:hypothetical protein
MNTVTFTILGREITAPKDDIQPWPIHAFERDRDYVTTDDNGTTWVLVEHLGYGHRAHKASDRRAS